MTYHELRDRLKPTIVIVDRNDDRWLDLVHRVTKAMAWLKSILFGDNVVEAESPDDVVIRLRDLSKLFEKALGDVVLECHGRPNGVFIIHGTAYQADNPEVLKEFTRLKGLFAPGARIIIRGCRTGSGPAAASRLQRLADATGAIVVAFKWEQTPLAYSGPSIVLQPSL
jgi:hypothetical protein